MKYFNCIISHQQTGEIKNIRIIIIINAKNDTKIEQETYINQRYPQYFLLESSELRLPKKLSLTQKIEWLLPLNQSLKAGIGLLQTLELMANQPKQNMQLTHLAWQLIAMIEQLGYGFSKALEQTKLFSQLELNWIRIGEHSGQLLPQCEGWKEQLQQQLSWKQQTKRLLMYPLMVFITMIGATLFLLLEVIPQLGVFLLGLGIPREELPIMTKILLFLSENVWISLGVIVLLLLVISVILWFFRISINWFLFRHRFLAQLFSDLQRLLQTGISLNQGLLMIQEHHNQPYLKSQLKNTHDLLMQGNTISDAFSKAGFTEIVVRLMNVAQQTGQLVASFEHLKQYYQQQFDSKIAKIQSLIAPMMTLFLGGLLALLLIGVLSPVYDSLQRIL